MDDGLFRQEAISALKQRRAGRPITRIPVSWMVLTVFLVAILVTAALFLAFGSYARKETALGQLTYETGELDVIAPVSGVIGEVRVADGDPVQPGQSLIELSTLQQVSEDSAFTQQLTQAITTELELLEDQEGLLTQRVERETATLERRISGIEQELAALDDQIATARRQSEVLQTQADVGAMLAEQGTIPERAREERELALLQHQQSAQALRARRAEIQTRRDDAEARLEQLPSELLEQRISISQGRSQLQRDQAEVAVQAGLILTSRTEGVVTAMSAEPGDTVRASERLLTVVSGDSALIAELYIESGAMALIEVGLPVRLMYDSFPYRTYGAGEGVIESISATVIQPSEFSGSLPIEVPVYRARVRMDRQSVDSRGGPLPLRSGMTLRAEIILEEQSFLQWLFEPLRRV